MWNCHKNVIRMPEMQFMLCQKLTCLLTIKLFKKKKICRLFNLLKLELKYDKDFLFYVVSATQYFHCCHTNNRTTLLRLRVQCWTELHSFTLTLLAGLMFSLLSLCQLVYILNNSNQQIVLKFTAKFKKKPFNLFVQQYEELPLLNHFHLQHSSFKKIYFGRWFK